jgi:hypothetical protein
MRYKLVLLMSGLLTVAWAAAQEAVPPSRADPYVPKAQRIPARQAGASGDALHAQALGKLRQRFNEADADHDGSLTRQEASAGGLGFVARHFDLIDARQRGVVSFEEVQAFLRQRAQAARAGQR